MKHYRGFDIHGQRLEVGHCEVHPWVGEEYPCSLCLLEAKKDQDDRRAQADYEEAQYREYCFDMERQHFQEMVTTA